MHPGGCQGEFQERGQQGQLGLAEWQQEKAQKQQQWHHTSKQQWWQVACFALWGSATVLWGLQVLLLQEVLGLPRLPQKSDIGAQSQPLHRIQ